MADFNTARVKVVNSREQLDHPLVHEWQVYRIWSTLVSHIEKTFMMPKEDIQ